MYMFFKKLQSQIFAMLYKQIEHKSEIYLLYYFVEHTIPSGLMAICWWFC
jgi:hypothetical protein